MPKNVFRPEIILSVTLEKLRELQRTILNETDYENQYAYGKEIYNDFNFNVGRKIHVLQSGVKEC